MPLVSQRRASKPLTKKYDKKDLFAAKVLLLFDICNSCRHFADEFVAVCSILQSTRARACTRLDTIGCKTLQKLSDPSGTTY